MANTTNTTKTTDASLSPRQTSILVDNEACEFIFSNLGDKIRKLVLQELITLRFESAHNPAPSHKGQILIDKPYIVKILAQMVNGSVNKGTLNEQYNWSESGILFQWKD